MDAALGRRLRLGGLACGGKRLRDVEAPRFIRFIDVETTGFTNVEIRRFLDIEACLYR